MIYIFIICSCIGSFVNVVSFSLIRKIDFVKRRSYCPRCLQTLSPIDLIPIFSYFILKGKCRYCHSPIPLRDTIVEFISGIIGLICYYHYGLSTNGIVIFIYFMILLIICLIDLDTMIIYDELIILSAIAGTVFLIYNHYQLKEHLIGFFLISIPMYLMNIIKKDSFGGGDIKLLAVCGFIIGYKKIIIAIIIAILLAGCVATYYIYQKKQKTYMPFAPYICIGVFISLFYGINIFNFYFSIL